MKLVTIRDGMGDDGIRYANWSTWPYKPQTDLYPYGFSMATGGESYDRYVEARTWAEEHFHPDLYQESYAVFLFRREREAIEFKLRWG